MAVNIDGIIAELGGRGLTVFEGSVEEYLNVNASGSSVVCVNEVDAEFDPCDNGGVLEGRYTLRFEIYSNGANASSTARASRETVLSWIASTNLHVFELTGWERIEEEALGTARFHINADTHITRDYA